MFRLELANDDIVIKRAREVRDKLIEECLVLEKALIQLSEKIKNSKRQKQQIELMKKSRELETKATNTILSLKKRISKFERNMNYDGNIEELENIKNKHKAINNLKKQGLF